MVVLCDCRGFLMLFYVLCCFYVVFMLFYVVLGCFMFYLICGSSSILGSFCFLCGMFGLKWSHMLSSVSFQVFSCSCVQVY